MPRLRVVEWRAWQRFLITHVVPDAEPVTATPGSELCSLAPPTGPALIHVNLSRPWAAFGDYELWLTAHEQAGLPVLNGYCHSIDKWAIQDACDAAGLSRVRASRDGDPEETLILKTRANHRGLYEQELSPDMVGDMLPPPWPYPERVHKLKRRDVPASLWEDRRIAIERFVTNAEGRFQRAYVVGDYVAVATSYSDKLVKEMDHRNGVELVSTEMASARPLDARDPLAVAFRLAREMRVDFAALDLALDEDGIVYPLDLNTTPSWGRYADLNPRLIGELIEAFRPLIEHGSSFAPSRVGAEA